MRHDHRSSTAAAALLLGVALIAPGAVARTVHDRHPTRYVACNSPHVTTAARSAAARLFSIASGPPGEYISDQRVELYGCLLPRGRVFALAPLTAPTGNVTSVALARFAGRFAAYVLDTRNEVEAKYTGSSADTITVVASDLKTGRTRLQATAVSLPASARPPFPQIRGLAVAGSGWAAWVLASQGSPSRLLAVDSHGPRQLDSGSIEPKSLAVSGNVLTWQTGGLSRSALLS